MKGKQYSWYRDNNIKLPTLSYSFENSNLCLLTKNTTLGEYYLPNSKQRINLIDQESGITLLLGLRIVDANTCKKIPNATVEVWSCNAYGEYSGFDPFEQEQFLRGKQVSDKLGFVEFMTIYPGFIDHRAPHINLKVSINGNEKLATQLFFPNDFNKYVMKQTPYNSRNQVPPQNIDDPIIQAFQGVQGGWPKTSNFGKKIMATITIGINT